MEEVVWLGIRGPSGKQVKPSMRVTVAFSKLSCMCAQWSSSNHNKQCFACTCLSFFLFLPWLMLSSSAFHQLFCNSSESRIIYNNHDHVVNVGRPNTTAPGSDLSPCIKTLYQNCSAEPRSLKSRFTSEKQRRTLHLYSCMPPEKQPVCVFIYFVDFWAFHFSCYHQVSIIFF